MSAHDNTFIDAYGLELTDELQGMYAETARPEAASRQQPTSLAASEPQPPKYRFDTAARRRTLRGPHFDMRRVQSTVENNGSAEDALDMNVIDVGAAWGSTSIIAAPPFDETPDEADLADAGPASAPVNRHEHATDELETTVAQDEPVQSPQPVSAAAAAEPTVTQSVRAEPVVSEAPAAEVAVTAAASGVPAPHETVPFAPVWEVDRFQWPDEIEQLFKSQTEYFDYAGKKLVAASREGLKVLAITSTRSGEGSTTLALCLARAAAGAGAKVGLLDGNVLRSELGEKLGVDFASGWQTAAASEQPLAEAAITGLEEGITLFPSSASSDTDLESLEDQRVGDVIRAAKDNFDLLILDVAAAELGSNVERLDAAIVVRDIRHTTEQETLATATSLRARGVKAVGIGENFSRTHVNRAAA